MRAKVIVEASALRDINAAMDWEDEREPGLGAHFLQCLAERFIALSITPGVGAVRYKDVRCTPIRVFKYLIHYRIDENAGLVKIYRVFSTSRKPLWD